jgi:Na+-driven multidrug efflux pump
MWFNLVIAIFNITITYMLVHWYGIIGAACGIVLIYTIAAICASYVVQASLKIRP